MSVIRFILTVYFTAQSIVSYGSFVILSASRCGDFAIFQNTETGKKILINTRSENMVTTIDSAFTFLLWLKDSAILFQKETGNSIELLRYQIGNGQYSIVDSIQDNLNWQMMINSDLISFPNTVNSYEDAFFVFIKESKVLKYNFYKKEVIEISAINNIKGFKLNNISIDNDCSTLLFASRSSKSGSIEMINLNTHNLKIIDQGVNFRDDASFVYFLQKKNQSLYYKVVGKANNIRTIEIYSYNVKSGIKYKIGVVKCVSLINPFEICSQKLLVINNVNPANFRLKIRNSFLEDFLNASMNSLHFIEIKLSKNKNNPALFQEIRFLKSCRRKLGRWS